MNSQTLRRYLITAGLLVLATALMLVFSVVWNSPVRADDDEDDDYRVDNQVIVKLNPAAATRIGRINATYGTRTLEKLQGTAGVYLLELPPGSDEDESAAGMAQDWRLLYAEPNFVTEAPEGDARYRAYVDNTSMPASEQYAAEALNLPCAHSINRGSGSVVAVLDTGVQFDHPDLTDNLEGIQGYDFVDDDADPSDQPVGLDEDGDGYADEMYGHGTHVAGIVDLAAPEAKIMPLRVLNSDGFGDVFHIAEAIYYAERNGANVVNMSLSTPDQAGLLESTVSKVSRRGGIVVVASAGNSGDMVRHYPAAGSSALAVTSVGEAEQKSTFATYGEWVDIAAPGEAIYSALPINDHAWWSGTSMAAPFVAGQAALIHSVDPYLPVTTIKDLIGDTARPLDEQDPTYSDGMGDGHADIGASLEQLSPGAGCGGA